ncbi:hypothetical protein PR048_028678 [Dryococelus australis]|uniref:Uncharacterized protein n=1 Tax=Dryococelus australis TaxID=614101 RepID=A0ABQ9GB89_9NEOP|nr:hypothetical protein PR048_028678 [Dryococelus australis]
MWSGDRYCRVFESPRTRVASSSVSVEGGFPEPNSPRRAVGPGRSAPAQLEEEHCTLARAGDEHLYAKTRLGKVKEAAGIAERRMEGARVCEVELVASSSHQTALGRARSAARLSSSVGNANIHRFWTTNHSKALGDSSRDTFCQRDRKISPRFCRYLTSVETQSDRPYTHSPVILFPFLAGFALKEELTRTNDPERGSRKGGGGGIKGLSREKRTGNFIDYPPCPRDFFPPPQQLAADDPSKGTPSYLETGQKRNLLSLLPGSGTDFQGRQPTNYCERGSGGAVAIAAALHHGDPGPIPGA